MSSRNPPTNFNPSGYSNLREYVEAVQGAPLDYSRPQQQDIVNAAVTAMYGGGNTSALQAFFPQAQTASTANTAGALSQGASSGLTAAQIANTPGIGSQGIGVNTASVVPNFSTAVGSDQTVSLGALPAAAVTFTPGLANQTAQQKADEYNRLRESFTDAEIRAAADATFGTQSASDWSYLTNLASQSNAANNVVTTGALPTTTETIDLNAGNLGGPDTSAATIANTSGLGTQGIGVNTATGLKVDDEVAETFKTVFGRAPTEGELAALRDKYGYTIEPGELNQIVLSKRDANVGYGVPTTQTVTPVYGVKEIIDEYGQLAQVNTITGYKDQNGNTVDPSLVTTATDNDGNFLGYTTPVTQSNFSVEGGTINKLTNQILAQDTTKYWSGEGYGSAQKSAADIALLLAANGITDINQFGKVTVAADAAVTPIYEQKLMYDPELGEYMAQTIVGYKDASGKAVDPSLVKTVGNEDGSVGYLAPVGTKEVFGNKVTGQAIDSHYAKANDDIFSGTFAGEGSTGYGVKFKADGSPVFYTQFMGSSNDLAQLLEDPLIGAIVQAAASYFGGPLGTAALNLAAGRDVDDVAKAALTSYVAGQVGNFVSGSESIVDALGKTGANIAGNVAGSVASGGGKEGALQALLTGGVNVALPEVTNLIPGYNELSSTQKSFVNNIVSNTLRDGDLSASDVINAAVASGKEAVRTAINDKLGETAFVESKRTGASDQDAFDASNVLTRIANANETFDGSALGSQNEAMNAAIADGKDKFTFGGKTFAIDNSAAMIADFTNSVLADAKADTDLRTKSDSEWGDLAGAQNAATARNTVTIGNAEANDLSEAAALAKIRDPSATSFTFDGKTYNVSASQSEMAAANKTATLAEIKDLPKFGDAYAQARALLGPNQTFEWNGKQYSTATAAERPDLSAPKVQAATDESAAETARLNRQNTALVTGNAPDQSAAETARLAGQNAYLKSMEKTGFLGQLYKDLNEQFRLQGVAANEYLRDNKNSPITASVSSAFDALGDLQRGAGGIALAFDNKPLADAIISGGDKIQKLGQSLGSAPEDTKNWKDTLDLIDKAKGAEKLAVLAGRIMDGKSGLARQVGLELRQELPALFLGGGLLRPTMVASGLIDTADTAGNAVVEAYDEVIRNKGNHQEGLTAGRKAGAAAGATEAAIQLTLGKLGDVAAGKLDNVISKGSTKVASEGVVEGAQEAGASAAVDVALGRAIDVNKALTQGIAGAAVGKGTATATSPVDAAQTITPVAETAATNIANNINTAISSGNTQNLGPVITENVASSIDSGASANVVVDSAITSAITGGADASSAITSTVTSALGSGAAANTVIDSAIKSATTAGADVGVTIGSVVTASVGAGANVDTTLASAVSSAVSSGANVNTVVEAATQAAASTGNNVTVASDANVVTITNATTNTNTTVDTATGVTTTVDNANNVTTTVDGNTTTAVDGNANTTTQTTVDANNNTQTTVVADTNANTNTQIVVNSNNNTTTSTTVDSNNNTTTQTTFDANTNTQTTVVTDVNANTQTTINVNANTGDLIDQKETKIPDDWEPPVIKPPVVPATATPSSATASSDADAAKNAAKKNPKAPAGAGAGAGGFGLPVGMDLNPGSLYSRETQKAIDPLARVKEIQAEFERESIMQNVDPRLMQVMQQRQDPQQQSQQFDKDIGALSKLLMGKPDAPNASNYYSYGAEDSIDDILGGKAANYKEGGFVEPLKASGGSMALPLLAKSGGALGHYKGREDFKDGKHVAGEGDGQSDDIPAWLADGEFVFPADVVSALGNGSTKAGIDKLYEMMHSIRDRARSKGPKDLPPPALKSPLDYLKSSKRSTS